MDNRDRQLSWNDIKNIAADADPAGSHYLEDQRAAQVTLDFMAGDDQAGYRILVDMADGLLSEYERAQAGTVWSTYILRALAPATLPDGREVRAGQAIYCGRSRNLAERDKKHRESLRSPAARARSVIATVLWHLHEQGCDFYLQPVAEDLTFEDAKRAEAALIASLLEHDAPLVNRLLLDGGKGGIVNHHPRDSPAYIETEAARHQSRYANDPDFRTRHQAQMAIRNLERRGDRLTPRKIEVITAAGPDYIAKARAMLTNLGRGEEWPTS